MDTTTIIGYRVKDCHGNFVHTDFQTTWASAREPEPIQQADAYRRIAAYITDHPGAPVPFVVPVHRQLSPLETASKELGGLLSSLCRRHNLNLGLTQDQIERRISKELAELGASPIVDQIRRLV